jgi:hypothetical protein
MARTITVYRYTTPTTRVVYGAAILADDGTAVLGGFPPRQRREWETNGVPDPRPGHEGEVATLDDGEAFLDLLLLQFRGGYVRAEETR